MMDFLTGQPGGIFQRLTDVFFFKVWVLCKQIINRRSVGHTLHND